jgi:hypothetical protein
MPVEPRQSAREQGYRAPVQKDIVAPIGARKLKLAIALWPSAQRTHYTRSGFCGH